jgi:hypothetical protein
MSFYANLIHYLPVSMFLAFVLRNDHVFAVARPMIIDLKSNNKSNILKPVISF